MNTPIKQAGIGISDMKTTAYYLENFKGENLIVETEDRDTALNLLSDFTGLDPILLLFKIGKARIVTNSSVRNTYVQKFWDVEKHLLSNYRLLESAKTCVHCGK